MGANAPIYSVEIIIFLATELKKINIKIWGGSGNGGVCLLKTGSDQSYPSF
jgi:hypothetical protein